MPNHDLIIPGLTLCQRKCGRDADAVVTEPGRERYPEVLCFDCIDQDLEREAASHVSRPSAALLAVAGDELELEYAEPAARDLLHKLATPATAQAAARCWAMLPDGSRCRRPATAGRTAAALFYCETHRHGCEVPEHGWSPWGRPVGPIRHATA